MPRADRHAQQSALRVWSIPIQAVAPNPRQPRQTFDEESLGALAVSIQQLGLLQPISVRAVDIARYELIAGERRLRACRQIGMTHIDALVLSASEGKSALLALVENMQREDLHYLDEAEGYATVLRDCMMTQEALASRIGKSQSAVANKLRLLKLDTAVRDALRASDLTERHARALLPLPLPALQLDAVQKIADRKLSVKQSEALIADMQTAMKEKESHPNRRVILLIRDHRLYINAIRDVVRQMDAAGIDADTRVVEQGDTVEIIVSIHKQQKPGLMLDEPDKDIDRG